MRGLLRLLMIAGVPVLVVALFFGFGMAVGDVGSLPARSEALRVASLNVLVTGDAEDAKLAFLRRADADVAGLIEVPDSLLSRLDEVRDVYPHSEVRGAVPNAMYGYGQTMVLLSRHPLKLVRTWGDELALYRVEAARPFYVLQVHPPAPSTVQRLKVRNMEFAMLGGEELPRPLVVMGDFNATPWDLAMRGLLQRQGLKLAVSYWPTFPAVAPVTPIDHVALDEAAAAKGHLVKVKGTDHLGVVADIRFAEGGR